MVAQLGVLPHMDFPVVDFAPNCKNARSGESGRVEGHWELRRIILLLHCGRCSRYSLASVKASRGVCIPQFRHTSCLWLCCLESTLLLVSTVDFQRPNSNLLWYPLVFGAVILSQGM